MLPFTALVGQDEMKEALVLNVIDPAIGGVLIRGERGTGKSTAVRALARLLPGIDVVAGCRFNCSPHEAARWCRECRERAAGGGPLAAASRPMRIVELPLNASEDRVVGAIDMEAAVRAGERRFEPGVLAAANRNILYVDEVNLLDDHLVDVLLDAAAGGENVVEREGVAISHPARFVLVATMNPEEGELRPQLLDRFGLCVDAAGLSSRDERVLVMEREELRHREPEALAASFGGREGELRSAMSRARSLLPLVDMPSGVRRFAVAVCAEANALGHRADIVVSRAARALRAWRAARARGDGELAVRVEDVVAVAGPALRHRRRDLPEPGGRELPPIAAARAQPPGDEGEAPRQAGAVEGAGDAAAAGAAVAAGGAESGTGSGTARTGGGGDRGEASAEVGVEAPLFAVRDIQLPRERGRRRTTGKRSSSPSPDRRGRYVASTRSERTTDVAFDATLRAAAPHQRRRREERALAGRSGPALALEGHDLRQKVRRRRTGALIVFVVDASASMDAEQRMRATKGAVLSLLRDAYVRRDRVSLIVFSGRTARVVLQPTSSIDLAEARLQRLAVGGTTPLTHGLVAGLRLIRSERTRDPGVYPLLVLISDGRGNISLFGDEPLVEAQRAAGQLAAEKVHVLVIDSARDHTQEVASARVSLPRVSRQGGIAPPRAAWQGGYGFNACLDLAERAGGEYLGLYDLSQSAIVSGVERSLRSG